MSDIINIIQSNANSVFWMVIFTVVISFLLSLVLVFTYDKTTPIAGRSYSFVQSLILMPIVTATIMQSIGDSLAMSFGVFGALAIIRFRSNISDARDIAFIFCAMSIGIACGVHSFEIGIIGTIIFCIVVAFLKWSPFDSAHNIKGVLRLEVSSNEEVLLEVERILKAFTWDSKLSRYRSATNAESTILPEYEYSFMIKDIKSGSNLKEALLLLQGINVTRIVLEDHVVSTNNY